MAERTHDGRPLKLLTIVDEYTRECLAIRMTRRMRSIDVSENASHLLIEPGSPWENGCVESFNGKFRDELLDREIFYTRAEAKVLVERWRREYNTIRPDGALGYRPPAPAAIVPQPPGSATLHPAPTALGLT